MAEMGREGGKRLAIFVKLLRLGLKESIAGVWWGG